MTTSPLVSYAQNGEDVVLWRALRGVERGRYVDVGANSPVVDSVTKLFYDRGWSGLDVEPVAEFAEQLRSARSRDVIVEAAVGRQDGGEVVLHEFAGTGLSTLHEEHVPGSVEAGHRVAERRVPARSLRALVEEHLAGETVHFCKIDVEGAEGEVLASVDLRAWRPWVLVVEATRPNSAEPTHAEWEPGVLDAGYRFRLFDGLSRFYVAEEHDDELGPLLSYPACSLDDYVPARQCDLEHELNELRQVHHAHVQETEASRERLHDLEAEVTALRAELVRWRGVVLERWTAAAAAAPPVRPDDSAVELERMRQTLSWRVTAPLRAVRARQLRSRA